MDKTVIRTVSFELKNFKNVGYGKIDLHSHNSSKSTMTSDILGIYGQNGSGKTSVVDAFFFLKLLLWGQSLPNNSREYISKGSDETECTFTFYFDNTIDTLLLEYTFIIKKANDDTIYVSYEKISYKRKLDEGWTRKLTLIEFDANKDDHIFEPINAWKKAISFNKDAQIDLGVSKKMARKERTSFIFSEDVKKLLANCFKDNKELLITLWALPYYAITNLFVIKSDNSGFISLNLALPFSYKYDNGNGKYSMGEIPVMLSEPTVQKVEVFNRFSNIINEIDKVIQTLIPGMRLEIMEYGKQATKDGEDGIKFEVLSVRGKSRIPIMYESEGIKKILSILNLLIAMYNNPSVCIVIDELDAGIYEYLLGEILSILQESGKGQLIFTSHNLRPLEMIDKCNLVFTTTNAGNRYIRLANVKTNNNLRDLYIRSINLGGQKETIYESTNSYEISRALRKAGKDFHA